MRLLRLLLKKNEDSSIRLLLKKNEDSSMRLLVKETHARAYSRTRTHI